MFHIFDGAVNGYRNAQLDSAKLSVDIEIGDRQAWFMPVIFLRIAKGLNDIKSVVISPVVGLITRPEPKEPPPMPELPEAFRGNPLGEGLEATYRQRTSAVIAGAESTKAMLNLDFTAMREQQSLAANQAARDRISLPENYAATAGVPTSGGTLVGGLVANIPPGTGGVRGALRSLMA